MLIDRLHRVAANLGLKPAFLDGIVAALLLALANWITSGQPLDFDGVKTAIAAAILGLVTLLAPAAPGVTTDDAIELSRVTDPLEKPFEDDVQHGGKKIAHRIANRRARAAR